MKIYSPNITGSLLVTGSNNTITGSLTVTQGITGSLFGTASWANNATSASFATTASFTTAIAGTTNYISKFTGTNTLGDSQIFDNGTNVGIGITSPTEKLDLNGAIVTRAPRVNNQGSGGFIDYTNGQFRFVSQGPDATTAGSYSFTVRESDLGGSVDAMVISNTGNIGIGTTSPNARLDVNGDTTITGSLIVSQSNNTINSIYTTNGNKNVPAYTFINDTDTGMYRMGTNALGLTAGGDTRVQLTNTSLVLIPGSTSIGTHLLMSDSNYTVSHVATSSIVVGSATTSTNATNIAITNDTTTNATYYPVFVSTTSGNTAARVDSSTLTYNPSIDTLTVPVVNSSTAVRGGNGTAAAPAHSFIGDTNTGMYNITADTLGFSTGGSERMRIDANGKVGIGVTNIEGKLHVYQNENLGGTTGNSLLLQTLQNTGGSGGNMVLIRDYALRDATGTSWTTWRHHNSIDIDGVYNTPGANTRTFWERDPLSEIHHLGSSNRYTFTVDAANNRVGVNAIAPDATLDVQVSGTTQTSILGRGQDGNFRLTTRQDVSTNTDGSVIGEIGVDYITTRNTAVRFHRGGSTTGGFISFTTNNGTEKMRIASGGNVGIGSTNPSARLHVEVNDNTYAPTAYFVNNNTGGSSITSATFIAGGKSSSFIQFAAGFLQISAHDTTGGIIIFKAKDAGVLFLDHVSSTPRVTIGPNNTATHPLRVTEQVSNVSIYADYDIVAYSDQSVKENVRPIENVINRINQSRGVLYDRIDSGEKDNIGFIAQELETTFPELVVTNEDGTKAVKYQNAVAVLFEAIKEQQKQIDELKQIINAFTK